MKIFEALISPLVQNFFKENFNSETTIPDANNELKSTSGITDFFETETELSQLKERMIPENNLVEEPDRAEYGDFQPMLN